MAITKETHPYELLVRWDREGKLAGAHVGFRTVIREDGEAAHEREEPVMPVDIGQGQGFPLNDILTRVQIEALARCAELEAANAALAAEATKLQQALKLAAASAQASGRGRQRRRAAS